VKYFGAGAHQRQFSCLRQHVKSKFTEHSFIILAFSLSKFQVTLLVIYEQIKRDGLQRHKDTGLSFDVST
jgi:hypothetical protein